MKGKWCILLLLFIKASFLWGDKGIVVAVCDRYMSTFLPSLTHLRGHLGCQLPIEIWHSGDELSIENRAKLETFEGVVIYDISEVFGCDPLLYRGWHIKPFLLHLCHFDEVILMDADLYFFSNPEILFDHPGYQATGAFFFRDRASFVYPSVGYKGFSIEIPRYSTSKYEKVAAFIRDLIPWPSAHVPEEWRHYWSLRPPTREAPYVAEHQESGCVVLDKKRHERGIAYAIVLNEERATTYKYVYGDKETYWLGFEMAKEAYTFNDEPAYSLKQKGGFFSKRRYLDIVQVLNGEIFYVQKKVFPVSKRGKIEENFTKKKRRLTRKERKMFQKIFQIEKEAVSV